MPPVVRVNSTCKAGSMNCTVYLIPLSVYLPSPHVIHRPSYSLSTATMGRNIYLSPAPLPFSFLSTMRNCQLNIPPLDSDYTLHLVNIPGNNEALQALLELPPPPVVEGSFCLYSWEYELYSVLSTS